MHLRSSDQDSATHASEFRILAELGISYSSFASHDDSPRPYFVTRCGSDFVTFLKNPDQRMLAWLSLERGYFKWLRQDECTALVHASIVDCNDAGHISVLSESQKTLTVLDGRGTPLHEQRLTITGNPISVRCHDEESWLIGTWKPGGVYLIDKRGCVLWSFAPPASVLVEARSVCFGAGGSCYIADAGLHRVLVINEAGRILSHYGLAGSPGRDRQRLANPSMIEPCAHGDCLICDTRNNRLLKISREGDLLWEWPPSDEAPSPQGELWMPWCVRCLPDDGLLIADTHNSRLIRLNSRMQHVQSYGSTPVSHRILSFPRSVEPLRNGRFLVADTYNNRVVELDRRSRVCWSFGGETGNGEANLFWPRRAVRLEDERTLIADSRHNRLVIVSPRGAMERVISTVQTDQGHSPLLDPHDVIPASNGHLFVVDTGNHRVLELDRAGRCVWLFSGPPRRTLNDPHHLSIGEDGTLLISDTGNDRIVVYNQESRLSTEIRDLRCGSNGQEIRLKQPRTSYFRYGHYWILDSGHSRLIIADSRRKVVWSAAIMLPESPLPRVTCPRWLAILAPDTILLSDYFGSRILVLSIPAAMKTVRAAG